MFDNEIVEIGVRSEVADICIGLILIAGCIIIITYCIYDIWKENNR